MPNLFTYGTLEIPEVMQAVTGCTFVSIEATAHGFARFLLQGRIYPGMIPNSKEATCGRLYFDVDLNALKVLDEFEDEVYRRQLISLQTQDGKSFEAFSYVIAVEDRGRLTSQPWCRDYFVTHHLHEYLKSCQVFYREMTS